ncbi:MAG TPA: NAD-dependent epimerase/dehydratase family protein [Oculatellaceae cyanobacterium]
MHSKRTVIIGGTGLVGCYLAADLLSKGHQVTVLSKSTRFAVPEAFVSPAEMQKVELVHGEITDVELLSDLIGRADVVFHKTVSQGMSGAVENLQQFLNDKIGAAAAVVEALRLAPQKPELLVLGSSISVYGEGAYQCPRCGVVRPDLRYQAPRSESGWDPKCPACDGSGLTPVPLDEQAARKGLSVYSVSKKAEEDLFAGACQRNSISMVGLRYSFIIGAGQSWHSPFTHFLDLLSAAEPPRLHEDGLQTRDYIFVRDVVAANMAVMKKHRPGTNFYNIASGNSTTLLATVNELSELYAQRSGSGRALEPIVDRVFSPGDVRHCYVTAEKFGRDFGIEPPTALSAGLRELVDWYVRKKESQIQGIGAGSS